MCLINNHIEASTAKYDAKFEENDKNYQVFTDKIKIIEQKIEKIDQDGILKIKEQEQHLESHERQLNDFIASHKINIKKEMYNAH